MNEGTCKDKKLTCIYKAENISTDKMLDALSRMRETAHMNHIAKVAEEQARYEQELRSIEIFRDMFYCSNYEK